MRKSLFAVLGLSVALILGTGSCFAQSEVSATAKTVAVTETSTVKVKPDIAYLSISIVTENKSSNTAVTENAKKMNSTIEALGKLGVKKEDIATSNYSVSIIRDYNAKVTSGLPYPIVGYSVQNTLKVTIRNIGSVGAIIDGVAKVNGIDISQLSFAITDTSAPRTSAIRSAVIGARNQANNVADALGGKIIGVKTIRVESSNQVPMPIYYEKGLGGASASAPTPISADDVSVSATVYAEFALSE
jgi:uncharacterized protein